MKTISIINLKGGVAKTTSSVNIGYVLAVMHNKRVLIVDNDKQGNASKMFKSHDYSKHSISEVLTEEDVNINEIICKTEYENIDIIPANMTLLKANLEVITDQERPQQTRFKEAFKTIENNYDYCIIDNAPDINISIINALVVSDDVLIPVKIDAFAFDGLSELKEQIDNTREGLNPNIKFRGCFVTCYERDEVNRQGKEWLMNQEEYPLFKTHIRSTKKAGESTFAEMPVVKYSRRCGASIDYVRFVEEYLKVSESDTN